MTGIEIVCLAFLVPCLAMMGAVAGIHLGTMIFGPIRINHTYTTDAKP